MQNNNNLWSPVVSFGPNTETILQRMCLVFYVYFLQVLWWSKRPLHTKAWYLLRCDVGQCACCLCSETTPVVFSIRHPKRIRPFIVVNTSKTVLLAVQKEKSYHNVKTRTQKQWRTQWDTYSTKSKRDLHKEKEEFNSKSLYLKKKSRFSALYFCFRALSCLHCPKATGISQRSKYNAAKPTLKALVWQGVFRCRALTAWKAAVNNRKRTWFHCSNSVSKLVVFLNRHVETYLTQQFCLWWNQVKANLLP